MTPHHLVAVWNPSYAADALDAHVQLLLQHVRDADNELASWDDAYVWWGRVRSPNRQQPLGHLPQILALNYGLDKRIELQLYLTDYRSLYVAEVTAVTTGNKSVDDPTHTPAYYKRDSLSADCWFKLLDIRALVDDDTPAVQEELTQLRVTSYADRPVSLYGGIVNLPLLVTRPDGALFFDDDERDLLNDGQLWVQADADRAELGGLVTDLRDNVIGLAAWTALLPTARTFVATAERLMRDHRRDTAFDFATVLVELSKALEVQVSSILAQALAKAPPAIRCGNVDGKSVDFSVSRSQSVGQLARIISHDRERLDYLATHLTGGKWFTEGLAAILDDLAPYRNAAAHSARRSRSDVLMYRDRIVGIGCEGVLAALSRVKVK
ncbi:MAG: hypothetical protein ACREN6_02660 [Gemmatimonadaceae bacterium]